MGKQFRYRLQGSVERDKLFTNGSEGNKEIVAVKSIWARDP